MAEIPQTLTEAIAQSRAATQAAIADGHLRVQVEIRLIELNPMPVAEQFLREGDSFSNQFNKVFFPDAGAAALARRDWGDVPFELLDISTKRLLVEDQIKPEDEAFLFIAPTAQEVVQLEKLCQAAGEHRPVVLLNPRLEDVSIVGIGYAGRQLRDRFLNNIFSCYYLQPLEEATLFRCYPSPWQVWRETAEGYQLVTELDKKPVGDDLDLILSGQSNTSPDAPKPKKQNIFASMQRFMRTLSR